MERDMDVTTYLGGTAPGAMATGRKPAMNKYTQYPFIVQFMKLLRDYRLEKAVMHEKYSYN
jgi:hypothetical protein